MRNRREQPPKIHPRGLSSLPGALHLGFANRTGVAMYPDSPDEPFVLYECPDPDCWDFAGGNYSLDTVLDRFSDKLTAAGCEWLIPILTKVKDSGGFRSESIIEAYRVRYGQEPVQQSRPEPLAVSPLSLPPR